MVTLSQLYSNTPPATAVGRLIATQTITEFLASVWQHELQDPTVLKLTKFARKCGAPEKKPIASR